MHEFSLVKKEVEMLRSRINGKKINRIVFFLGRLAHGTVDSITEAFKVITANSPLSDAEIQIVSVEPKVKCSFCRDTFNADSEINLTCPKCGSKSNELIAGNECHIDSIEVED